MFEWVIGGHHCVPDWNWMVKKGEHYGYTIWYVAKGKGTLSIGEESFFLLAGDIFFINYKENVIGTEDLAEYLSIYYIDFVPHDASFFDNLPCYARVSSMHFVETLFIRFLEAYRKKDEIAKLNLAAVIAQEYRVACEGEIYSSPYDQKIEDFCIRMQKNPKKQYNLCTLAKEMGVSVDHFIRMFTKKKGVSPHQYLLSLRLETAITLLQMSDNSVTEIAECSGFSDVYSFSRFFKKKTGLSPTEFKKEKHSKNI